jgi:hypothetical protein
MDFDLAPPLVRARFLGLPFFAVAGAISAVMFAFLVWSALKNTDFSGVKAGIIPHLVLLFFYGTGGAIWVWRRRFPGARPKLDPKNLYNQLPPE